MVRADLGQQLFRAGVVELVVLLTPATDHAVRRRHHHVVHPLVARDPVGQRGAGQADPRTEVEDVDRAEHLTENAGHSGGRVDLGGGDLQQGGLACPVRTEDHPSLVLLDRPVDAFDQCGLATPDADVGELQNGVHSSLNNSVRQQ
jgi:hypothetical protein